MTVANFMLGEGWLWRGWEKRWCWSWALKDGAGVFQGNKWLQKGVVSSAMLSGSDIMCILTSRLLPDTFLLLEMSSFSSLTYPSPAYPAGTVSDLSIATKPSLTTRTHPLSSLNSCSLVCFRPPCPIWWWCCFPTKEENSEGRRSSTPWNHVLEG